MQRTEDNAEADQSESKQDEKDLKRTGVILLTFMITWLLITLVWPKIGFLLLGLVFGFGAIILAAISFAG